MAGLDGITCIEEAETDRTGASIVETSSCSIKVVEKGALALWRLRQTTLASGQLWQEPQEWSGHDGKNKKVRPKEGTYSMHISLREQYRQTQILLPQTKVQDVRLHKTCSPHKTQR